MDLNKCVMKYIHHYNIIQDIFITHKNPLCSNYSFSLCPQKPLIFLPHSFCLFLNIIQSESYSVQPLQNWLHSLSNMHLIPPSHSMVKSSSLGAPGWLSGLSLCLWLRSWSQGPGIEPRIGLSAQQGACFPLSLSACLSAYL